MSSFLKAISLYGCTQQKCRLTDVGGETAVFPLVQNSSSPEPSFIPGRGSRKISLMKGQLVVEFIFSQIQVNLIAPKFYPRATCCRLEGLDGVLILAHCTSIRLKRKMESCGVPCTPSVIQFSHPFDIRSSYKKLWDHLVSLSLLQYCKESIHWLI